MRERCPNCLEIVEPVRLQEGAIPKCPLCPYEFRDLYG